MRPTILRYDSLPSTNTEAASQAQRGAAEGVCVVALEQTAGRGRQQRSWASPRGAGLYLSIVLRPRLKMVEWPLITLMTSLVVSDALKDSCGIQTDIKWPNDLLVEGRKVTGILTETVETNQGRAAIVGIGINLKSSALPDEFREFATSVEDVTGNEPDSEELLKSLMQTYSRRYEALQRDPGPDELIREWTARSIYALGKRVRINLGDEIVEGITRGLARDGALRVETETGDVRLVRAGDVANAGSVAHAGTPEQ